MLRLQLVDILLLDLALAVVDDILNVFRSLERIDQTREQVRVEEYGLGVCLLQGMAEPVFAERVVRGDNGDGLSTSAYERSCQ